MIIFLKYFKFYHYKILGSQNLISNNKSLLFNNSGFSALKDLIIKSKINISSYQYCLRSQGIYNDLKLNHDGIHKTSFIMLGNFFLNNNIYKYIKLIKKYLFFFVNLKKKNIYFTLNKNDFTTIIILLLLNININNIIFTKKNIWKIEKIGFFGFSFEIYYKINKKLLEIWNIVNIRYLKLNNKIKKIKFNIIDTGFGIERIKIFKKKNLKLIDIFHSIFLIFNNINLSFTKNHSFLLNKLIKKIFYLSINYNIRFFSIFFYYFKNYKKFYFNYNLNNFLIFLLKKESFLFFNLKKINIEKINLKNLKKNFETYGIPYSYFYKIIKKKFK